MEVDESVRWHYRAPRKPKGKARRNA
jgi:hypothetical protein